MLHSENFISIYVLFIYKSWTVFYFHTGPSSMLQREKKDMLWCLWWVWLNFYYGLPLLFIEMAKTFILHNKCGVGMDGTVIEIRKVLSVFLS